MSLESGQRLSVEELKQLNRPKTMLPQPTPMPPANLSQREWDELLAVLTALYQMEKTNSGRLERLEADVGAQEALLRALTRQAGQLPIQAQLEALAQDVAQIQATLKQDGKKRERCFSLPKIRLPKLRLPYIPWSSLLLGLTALLLAGGVLWAAWFSWEKLWNMMQALIP